MRVPLWALLGFAAWTVLPLLGTIGVYRWSRILSGRVPIRDLRADRVEGDDFYKRAMRAHANCIENLSVFGAIVLALYASGIRSATADAVSVAILAARVVQSLVHVSFEQTNTVGPGALLVLLRSDRRLRVADRDRGLAEVGSAAMNALKIADLNYASTPLESGLSSP